MAEDVGVTVTVTRLRRRLSGEQSESSPSTPTKKRGGRLAAKPQLDLIDENAQVSSPKKRGRPRKEEPLAKDDAEEKTITPSRRSTRIRSNTSIISETLLTQNTHSPRAKRAARRSSVAGSDNEAPATPIKQTRRTRKDSASSVENQEPAAVHRPLQVTELVIHEEPEKEVQKPATKSKSSPKVVEGEISPSTRKSTRLLEKRNSRSGSHNKSDHDCAACSDEITKINISTDHEPKSEEVTLVGQQPKSSKNSEINDELSESHVNLLKKLDTQSEMGTLSHNKSASNLETGKIEKKKRNRTESWPLITVFLPYDNIAVSDDENAKKRKTKSENIIEPLTKISGTDLSNTSARKENPNTDESKNNTSVMSLDTSSKKKKRQSDSSLIENTKKTAADIQLTETQILNESNSTKTSNEKKTEKSNITQEIETLFEKDHGNIQAIVYFEDSDSNGVNAEKTDKIVQLDSGDQCVPVVNHHTEFKENSKPDSIPNDQEALFPNQPAVDDESSSISQSKQANAEVNNSCEPMDIDESIHEEIEKSRNTLLESYTHHKSTSINQLTSDTEPSNKSKRKSSISSTPNKSQNENKSTLILSRIKDVSTTSENTENILKSPKVKTIEALSQSSDAIDGNENKLLKTNVNLDNLKGTPLKQNNVQKLTMQTSTPITTQQTNSEVEVDNKKSSVEKTNSDFSQSLDDTHESEGNEESSTQKSKFLDDEAEEANDSYESGDSQDEEEKQFNKENEVVERGETLDSDDDVSNDTDYEKDSFVVSSDAEDSELLSGTGDDLSMTDNELTMSKKSKKKYDERKLKDQKRASKEMFESRHKLNDRKQKSLAPKEKNKRMRIDSSLLESDEEVIVKAKKNNRLRLDSTLDSSTKTENIDESLKTSNKSANKTVQKSISNQSLVNEKEITICNESNISADPLQVQVKQEPKTPQKGLFDISVVQFTDRQDIESIDVVEGKSILNQTEADPLLSSMICEVSDSSESEEIMQNYDFMLNKLNKCKKKEINNYNASLNMDKRAAEPKKEPIIDQLNLTHTKKPKKSHTNPTNDVNSKTLELSKVTRDSDNDASSNSIDLKLLFSEDNCGSGDESITNINQQEDGEQMFVPVRKSVGKTNILENIGANKSQDNSFNESNKKKKKRKSSLVATESVEIPQDTTLVEESPELNKSGSKKKKNRASVSITELTDRNEDVNQSVYDLLNESKSKNKKKQNTSITDKSQDTTLVEESPELNKSGSKKKKNRASVSITELTDRNEDVNQSVDDLLNESKSKNKKKQNTSITDKSQDLPQADAIEVNKSSAKKKKNRSSLLATGSIEEIQDVNQSVNDLLNESNLKNKKRQNPSKTDKSPELPQADAIEVNKSSAKKKNRSSLLATGLIEEIQDVNQSVDDLMNKSNSKNKKKQNTSITDKSRDVTKEDLLLNESTKKKKKRKSSLPTEEIEPSAGDIFFIDTTGTHSVEKDVEVSEAAPNPEIQKKKKKKKSHDLDNSGIEMSEATPTSEGHRKKKSHDLDASGIEKSEAIPTAEVQKKKKKKKDHDLDNTGIEMSEVTPTLDPLAVQKKKKKKKKTRDLENSAVCDDDSDGAPEEIPYLSEKASNLEANQQTSESIAEPTETNIGKKKKKKKKTLTDPDQSNGNANASNGSVNISKKRKRSSSEAGVSQDSTIEGTQKYAETAMVNESSSVGNHKKKRKICLNEEANTQNGAEGERNSNLRRKQPPMTLTAINEADDTKQSKKKKKKKKNREVDFQNAEIEPDKTEIQVKKNKKRKERDEDMDSKNTKILKEKSFERVHIRYLPDSIISQLDDKPRKILEAPKVLSTSNFIVENARQKRAKPSNYLEESVYLDAESPVAKKDKPHIKKPKVLPFMPTAAISETGFTTKFKIDKLPKNVQFVAEPAVVTFSKEQYLQKKDIKRLGTYDRYKKQINKKLTKF